jgi:glycosyltransferase involved in cell wall biosynthesis
MDILALIPAYQAAPHVGAVVRGALEHLPVVVVDDGSTDATGDAARAAGAEVLVQPANQGKGAALRRGFGHALEVGARAVVTLDADGQHDPTEIPAFLAAERAGSADLIIGRRDFRRMPLSRRVANQLGTWTLSWAVGQPIPDNQSGYRLIGASLMRRLLDSREDGFEFEVEMIAVAIRDQMRIAWVPIRTIYGDAGSHVRPVAHVSRFLRTAQAARRMVRGS